MDDDRVRLMSHPPRIMHVITGLGTGGAEASLVRVLRTLDEPSRHIVVSLTTDGAHGDTLRSLGVTVYALELARGRVDADAFRQMQDIVRTWTPDILQGWMYHGNVAVSMLRLFRAHRGPICWNVRHALDAWTSEPRALRALIRASSLLSSGVDRIVYNSVRSSEQHVALGFKTTRAVVIPNGVDTTRFAFDRHARQRLRAEWGIPSAGRVIGLVARVHPLKDHRTFLEAAARIAQSRTDVWFALAGTDTDAGSDTSPGALDAVVNELRARVPALGTRLLRLGERRDVAAVLSACDVVALSSTSEGSPNAAAEAMACMRPCVVTDVGDAAMLVANTGLVVPPRDSAAMAHAWLSLLGAPEECARRGAAARERILTCFAAPIEARAYADVWASMMGRRRPPHEHRLLLATTVATTLRAFLLPYAARMRELGWRVDAVANGATKCEAITESFSATYEAPWSRRLTDIRALIRSPTRLRALVADGGYDVVHVHTPIAAFLTRFALRNQRPRVRIVYTAHGFHAHPAGHGLVNACFRAAERLASRWTDYLVVINADDDHMAEAERLVPSGHRQLHPGIGVDTGTYRPRTLPERMETRRALGVDPNACMIAVVGEFNGNKRQGDVVRALAMLRDTAAGAVPVVVFIGEGHRREEVARLGRTLSLGDRVRFLGQRADVPALVGASDMLVLASGREGLPRCLLEAMSMGIPVVASAARGSRDLLAEGRGRLYPIGDVPALVDAIGETRRDAEETCRRAARGRAWVFQHADLTRLIEAHVALYDAVLGGGGIPPVPAQVGEPALAAMGPLTSAA